MKKLLPIIVMVVVGVGLLTALSLFSMNMFQKVDQQLASEQHDEYAVSSWTWTVIVLIFVTVIVMLYEFARRRENEWWEQTAKELGMTVEEAKDECDAFQAWIGIG